MGSLHALAEVQDGLPTIDVQAKSAAHYADDLPERIYTTSHINRVLVDGYRTSAVPIAQDGVGRAIALVYAGFGDGVEIAKRLVRSYNCMPQLEKAARQAWNVLEHREHATDAERSAARFALEEAITALGE